jgi:hypothetical protein
MQLTYDENLLHTHIRIHHDQGWPEPYTHPYTVYDRTVYDRTVYDRIYGDIPAKNFVYAPYVCVVRGNPSHDSGWPEPYIYTIHDHIFGGLPAKIPCMHRMYVVLASPSQP